MRNENNYIKAYNVIAKYAKILNIVMHDMQFIKFKSLKIALYGDT